MKTSRWYSPRIARNLLHVYQSASPSEISEGLNWYTSAHSYATCLASKYNVSVPATCGIIAALSPGRNWELNLQDADTFLTEWTNGRRDCDLPLVGTYGWRNIVKASKIASGQDPLDVLGGDKVRSFYQNLLDPSDPSPICIDRHAASAAELTKLPDSFAIRGSRYSRYAKHYSHCAGRLSIIPSQLQAIVWTVWRNRYESFIEVPF